MVSLALAEEGDRPEICDDEPGGRRVSVGDTTNLKDQVGHHLPSWMSKSGRPPLDLPQVRGIDAHLCPFFDGGGARRGSHGKNSQFSVFVCLLWAFKAFSCPTEAVSLQKKGVASPLLQPESKFVEHGENRAHPVLH